MSEFKVGDVAWAEFRDGSGGERVLLSVMGWMGTRGPIARNAESSFIFRPLAVVDPDTGDAGRLFDLMREHGPVLGAIKFTEPRQAVVPKPPEPLRLGAAVKDREGTVWLRVSREGSLGPKWAPEGYVSTFSRWLHYSDIDVVEADVEVVERESG